MRSHFDVKVEGVISGRRRSFDKTYEARDQRTGKGHNRWLLRESPAFLD
jgi:hypothetical protein